ncbi:MAG: type II toxin-antitoxin system RelE/ParE family toxin [Armatimonadota bacterium]|nr:type II toxin-antitoxin system RelE/ParE family toxin [Armatimonadota bacterium]
MAEVVWTEAAAEDLDAAAKYIARDSPRFAAAIIQQAFLASDSLAVFAARGRMVPELSQPEIRELSVQSYRLIYHSSGELVAVLGFIHQARDLPSL